MTPQAPDPTRAADAAPATTLQAQQVPQPKPPPPPPTPAPPSAIQIIRGPLELIQFLAVIAGAIFIVVQLYIEAEARKTDRTLDFAARFDDDKLGQVRRDLITPWFDYTAEIQKLNEAGADEAVVENLVREIVRTTSKDKPDHDLRLAIYDMADFFDQLSLCMAAERCDEDTAKTYFGPFAKDFHCLYGVIILDLRKDLSVPYLGAGLQRLVAPDACYQP